MKKKKRLVLIFPLIAAGIGALAYIRETELVCPARYFVVTKITESQGPAGSRKLRIEGLIRGLVAADNLASAISGDDMQLKLYATWPRQGHTQYFDHIVEVPAHVKRVVYGKEHEQIWPQAGPEP